MKYFQDREFRCRCCRELPPAARENIEALTDNVLDVVRAKFQRPIKVNSGYRCPKHNAAVGGAKGSQHLCQSDSAAADICAELSGYENMAAWKEANCKIAQLIVEGGRFDQLIIYPTFVHVSWKRLGNNRKQILRKTASGYEVLRTV